MAFGSYYEDMLKRKELKHPQDLEQAQKKEESEETLQRAIRDMIERWKKQNYSEEALKLWK